MKIYILTNTYYTSNTDGVDVTLFASLQNAQKKMKAEYNQNIENIDSQTDPDSSFDISDDCAEIHGYQYDNCWSITSQELDPLAALDNHDPDIIDFTPDNFETGDHVKTPRGYFYVTALNLEQMEMMGYGVHHTSDDGRYYIMGNGNKAFAVAKEQTAEMKALCEKVISAGPSANDDPAYDAIQTIMKCLPDKASTNPLDQPSFWSDGKRIYTASETACETVAGFLTDALYESSDMLVEKGYFNPIDDATMDAVDKCTGFHFIDFGG